MESCPLLFLRNLSTVPETTCTSLVRAIHQSVHQTPPSQHGTCSHLYPGHDHEPISQVSFVQVDSPNRLESSKKEIHCGRKSPANLSSVQFGGQRMQTRLPLWSSPCLHDKGLRKTTSTVRTQLTTLELA